VKPTSIAERLLFNTVRVDTTYPNEPSKTGSGTAFAFMYEEGGEHMPFLVTNKHVVVGADTGILTFFKGLDDQPILGAPHILRVTDFPAMWHGHPDPLVDVAVTPLAEMILDARGRGIDLFVVYVDRDRIPTEHVLEGLDAIEEVVFIGYPNGIWDTVNFTPIVRRGVTATPIVLDFRGKKQFLVDASVFPGSSGSPVFIIDVGMVTDKHGTTTLGSRVLFLGVLAKVLVRRELGKIAFIEVPTTNVPVVVSRQMIDLGVVFKPSTILETIEDFLEERRLSAAGTTSSPAPSAPTDPPARSGGAAP